MSGYVRKLYVVTQTDDDKLAELANHSGTGNKSAELRTLIRREYIRVFGKKPVLDLEPKGAGDEE